MSKGYLFFISDAVHAHRCASDAHRCASAKIGAWPTLISMVLPLLYFFPEYPHEETFNESSPLYWSCFVDFFPHSTGSQIISCGEISALSLHLHSCPLEYLAVQQHFCLQEDKPFHFSTLQETFVCHRNLFPIPKEGLGLSGPDICALPSLFAQITLSSHIFHI